MSIDRSAAKLDAGSGSPPAGALVRLAAERDAVLRGLVHALSNRAGTVGAVAGMLDPDAPAAGVAATVLQGEVERMEALLAEFRLLATERSPAPEPVHLPDLLESAIALHAHHPTFRDVPCTVEDARALPPVLADPAEVADVLLVMLGAAKAAVWDAGAGSVQLRGAVAGDEVRVHAAAAGAADAAEDDDGARDAQVLAWTLADGVGTVRIWRGGGSVRLPTLSAARRAG